MNSNRNLLCMKWDEFDHFVVSGVFDLYQKDEMADVTLFCEGRSFKAHRVLLCMWSSYFKEVFSATSHPHPVIILRETTSADLELILRFIYQGQLFVPYEDADRFLKTAEYFQIAGLRNMRIHSTPEESATTFPSNSNFVIASNPSKSQSHSLSNSTTQPMQSFGTSTMFTTANGNNSSGVPVRIISNSNSPSSASHQHSIISPVSIISETASQSQNQFSSNVIRSSTRPYQRGQLPMRSTSPVQSTPIHTYHHCESKLNHEEIVYQAQPVVLVHNPLNISEYHNSQRPKGPQELRKSSESVVILENESNSQIQMTSLNQETAALTQTSSRSGNYAVYSQNQPLITVGNPGQEEVLGLEYLHENSRSSHSQIIQEAAAAAGVEDTEIMQHGREITFPSSTANNSCRGFKQNSVVLTATNTPVYAVKRVPPTPSVQQPSSSSNTNKKDNLKHKVTKSKAKSRKHITVVLDSSDTDKVSKKVEFVSCPKCSKRVKKTSLNVHMKRTHLDEGTVLVCPICGKQISSKGVYYKHMYLHRQKSEFNNSASIGSK